MSRNRRRRQNHRRELLFLDSTGGERVLETGRVIVHRTGRIRKKPEYTVTRVLAGRRGKGVRILKKKKGRILMVYPNRQRRLNFSHICLRLLQNQYSTCPARPLPHHPDRALLRRIPPSSTFPDLQYGDSPRSVLLSGRSFMGALLALWLPPVRI